MSSWLASGRPSILDALVAACDGIDEQARAEIRDRDRKHAQLLEELAALKSRAGEVDRLSRQNESLRAEISRLCEEGKDALDASSENRTILSELSPNKPTGDRRSATLQAHSAGGPSNPAKAYMKLAAEYKKARQINEAYKTKLRQRREEICKWAGYADSLEKRIQDLHTKLQRYHVATDGITDEQKRTHASLSGKDSVCDTLDAKKPLADLSIEFIPERLDSSEETESGTGGENIDLPSLLTSPTEHHDVAVKPEPLSDEPVVVSARSVRKRKHRNQDLGDGRLQRIKSEHSSSSGIEVVSETPHFSAAEAIDFEEEAHVPTPRKRRFLPREDQEYAVADLESTSKLTLADVARSEILGAFSTPDKSWPTSHLSSALHDSLHYLQRSYPETNSGSRARRNPYVSPLTLGVMDLAEDGEDVSKELQRPAAKSRLDNLLNSPPKNALTPINRNRMAPEAIETSRTVSFHNFHEGVQTLRLESATPKAGAKPKVSPSMHPSVARERGPKRPSILREDMPRGLSATREEARLRERPIERLRPEDFKPNPRYNDGLTYVYDEVVRGKDARAALSGCIDPNCCGKTFKHFAEAELKEIGPSIMTRAEGISLMEKYLGDEAWQIGTATREEKEKIWVLAKTWDLANKFGKHRQRYSRMPTPPGFWSVDFPNTQERAEELRQAEEIRKALVRERYREAMRCDGSWLFRDEEPR
ncbi:hypothetical protein M406DRAFT_334298 [Cryphonectria parasitica EP155]|uniref:DNA endonuclease activator Ctp1 C-terminal domain-containing protein n=1 Tax=Cryphonectria parasitica (strain ATCC 38755 / EP155) TaxID=660469 RepID=A0A9P5CIQ5_CRYP1|nr:uncharacterized protein M406DRAFT_334298 [Cryphonectria parasitica EP155]KAF3760668.1 hypothetical protein M406DRAFT_334298 [Cryphonectria parasitica EP155]